MWKAASKLARPSIVLCDLSDFASTLQHHSGILAVKHLSTAGLSGGSFFTKTLLYVSRNYQATNKNN